MRKVIILVFAFSLCTISKSQVYLGTDIYLKQIGGVYSNTYKGWCAYSSIGKLTIQKNDNVSKFKLGIGKTIIKNERNKGYISLGVAYNQYWGDEDVSFGELDLHKVNIDVISSIKITNKFYFLFSSDIINWDFLFGIGYDFTTRQGIYDRKYRLLK